MDNDNTAFNKSCDAPQLSSKTEKRKCTSSKNNPKKTAGKEIELILAQKRHITKTINTENKHLKSKKRTKKNIKSKGNRRLWEDFEDKAVRDLVGKYGVKKWVLIAKKLEEMYNIKDRNGKQCRERWHNHLNPDVKKIPLSDEEEKLIFEKHREYGNKWAEIAKALKGRTDNVVKNYFYATLRRQFRKILKRLKGKTYEPPEEVTLEYINKIMKENDVPYCMLDNQNIRMALEVMNGDEVIPEKNKDCNEPTMCRYSL